MNEPENPLQTIFSEALEIENAQQRAAFLAQACGADVALRREIEELLQASTEARGFLPDKPAAGGARAALLAAAEALGSGGATPQGIVTEQPGDRIGRYKLLQRIGEGGCGVVYMAEQEEPVRRKVALKVIKLGMDTKQVVGRFEAERQALALMDHPSIAKVLDAGATNTGRPFFVMELVRGIRVTDYCNQNALSTRERLELFIKVCQAVQHAHQKGIIHRDLKPSNILVTENDGVPVPKVIDFGIAKATEGRLTNQTLFTAFEQFMGTPAYMSPEQAALTSLDIDTRSDIYSLGVLLYELLTGTTPFDTKALLAAGLDELRRTIREKEPARPSTRLTMDLVAADVRRLESPGSQPSTLNPQPADRVSSRRLLPKQKELINLIRGDLDWIVMKCLEKDRTRRYETANGLASDIKRHLNNEPVVARPPSRLYEFQKTVRRHKFGFAATGAVITVLAAGVLVSTLEALRARSAEHEQSRLRLGAEAARLKEAELQQRAEQEARSARLAEADAEQRLRDSYLAQAQAGRWSGRAGRRFDGLALLQKAAEIRPSVELRNEAIACMALPDLRVLKECDALPKDDLLSGHFDAPFERYVFGDAEGTIHVYRVQDATELMQFPGYEPPFHVFAFSRNGRFLFVACGRKSDRVEVLDLGRQEVILRLSEPNCRTMAFSADGRLVAVSYGQRDSQWPVRIFDLALRKEVAFFNHGSLPYFVRFHPKQPGRLLTSDWSPTVRIWDWQTGRVVQSLPHPDWVQGIDWHPEGAIVATACADKQVRLWDAATGKELATLPGHQWSAVGVTFSRDGAFLASNGWDGMLRLWDVYSHRELVHKLAPGGVSGFGSTANKLAIKSGPGTMAILEMASGQGYRLLRGGLAGDERSVACDFSPDGRLLVSTHTRSVRLWDVTAGTEIARVTGETWFRFAKFHPDGTNLFLNAPEGVENWLLAERSQSNGFTLTLRRRLDLRLQTSVFHLTHDGGTLAGVTSGDLVLVDTTTARTTARLKPPYRPDFSALSADGQLAATWSRLSTNIQIWDVARSNVVHEVPAHLSIYAVFSPNNLCFVVGDRAEFRAWNLHNWQSLYALPRDPADFYGYMAFSPDSRVLAVAVSRSTVRLVEAATGRELATLEAPDPVDIHWISFNANGTQLAVVGGSGPIQLWDLRRIRQQLATMKLDWELPPYPDSGGKQSSN